MSRRRLAWSRAAVLPVLVVLAGAALASCGGDSSTSNNVSGGDAPAAAATATPTAAPSATVTIADNSFSPETLTIKAGTTVQWLWTGNNTHSVLVGGFESAKHAGSGTFEQTFRNSGATVRYQCGVHGAAMSGTIIVN